MAALTDDDARAQLTLLLQPASAPALTDSEVDQLTTYATIDDPRALPYALYLGWTAKAAKATAKVDIKAGDVAQSASQLHDHCVAEAARWAVTAGVETPGTAGRGIGSAQVWRA